MRVHTSLAWLLWLGLLAGCAGLQEPDRSAPQSFEGRGFRATLRKDVLHNAITPEPSVTLYDFHVGSQPILFIYAGDRPGYPHYTWPADHEDNVQLPSGLRAHCRQAKGARECVITLGPASPKRLHVFYEGLSPEWASVADAIIQSLEPRSL